MAVEIHVQLAKKPAAPIGNVDVVSQLKRKSTLFAKRFKEFLRGQPDDDWTPITIAIVCPHLLDAKLTQFYDFVNWVESLTDDSAVWTFDEGVARIFELNKAYCNDVANVVSGMSFSTLTSARGHDMVTAPVLFMTYRRKDIRDL